MKQETKHTALPWDASHRKVISGYSTQVYTKDGETIATMHWYPKPEKEGVTATYREENARFVVKACNSYYELLEALKAVIKLSKPITADDDRTVDWACEIVAKATEGK